MKISAKTNYACKALMELAVHWPKKTPVGISIIARNQHIPIKFLTHILIQLKSIELVDSNRGKFGGYYLKKSPKDITLRDVVENFEGGNLVQLKGKNIDKVLNSLWHDAEQAFLISLSKITIEDILHRERAMESIPMYTI